jgi:hypothetical protein
MSLLPQRKKSPEEIANLRESLGIPAFLPGEEPAPPPDAAAQDMEDRPNVAAATDENAPVPVQLPNHSEQAHPDDVAQSNGEPAVHVLTLKPVRSLRKSEQIPGPVVRLTLPPADSSLPSYRHSDAQLNEIRRRDALAMLTPAVHPKLVAAHPFMISLGYVAALAGAVAAALDPPTASLTDLSIIRLFGHSFAFDPRPLIIPVSCVAAALLVAAVITARRPFSRPHAAFISVISLFVLVFGALHYFPQLRHGT